MFARIALLSLIVTSTASAQSPAPKSCDDVANGTVTLRCDKIVEGRVNKNAPFVVSSVDLCFTEFNTVQRFVGILATMKYDPTTGVKDDGQYTNHVAGVSFTKALSFPFNTRQEKIKNGVSTWKNDSDLDTNQLANLRAGERRVIVDTNSTFVLDPKTGTGSIAYEYATGPNNPIELFHRKFTPVIGFSFAGCRSVKK